jgi:hypothetical protein
MRLKRPPRLWPLARWIWLELGLILPAIPLCVALFYAVGLWQNWLSEEKNVYPYANPDTLVAPGVPAIATGDLAGALLKERGLECSGARGPEGLPGGRAGHGSGQA